MSSIIDDLKMQYKFGGITQRLIYWNVACFILSLYFYHFDLGYFEYPRWIALYSDRTVALSNPWTFITYAFFHDGFGHIFFNMILLNFASTLFLTFFTQKQLFGLYILSALFAGFAFVFGYYFLNQTTLIVGASAAIMAILVATTTYQPLMNVRLLLVGNVKLWHITLVILIIDLMQIRIENTGGHIAHLAGAFFGFIFIKLLQNGIDMSKMVSNSIDFLVDLFEKKNTTPFKKVHKNYSPPPVTKSASKIVTKSRAQQQMDEILDKISQSGYDSLSKEEKEFLFKAGK